MELLRQGGGPPLLSPVTWSDSDYHDKWIGFSAHFAPGTGALIRLEVWRDEECVFHRFAFGLGPDNTPETSPTIFAVPVGTPDNPGATYFAPQLGLLFMLNISFLFSTQWTALRGD